MSAICRNTGWRAVNDGALKSTAPSITARPTPQEKRSFAEVAARLRVSESTLALIAIRTLLDSDVPDLPPRTSSSDPAVDRITIRLRPGDRLAIRKRAAGRRMKDSAYIAALVRRHLAANPPLASDELAARGRRLHIDKELLRGWREDFAQLMREQGIAANATPRAIRGGNKKTRREGIFKAQRYGKSTAMRDRVIGIAAELSRSGTVVDPARERLLETRRSLVSTWMKAADVLDAQGEEILAGDVRYFARHLPPVLTDRQKLAAELIGFTEKRRRIQRDGPGLGDPVGQERTL